MVPAATRRILLPLMLFLTLLTAAGRGWSWCSQAHEKVNAAAIERLPNGPLREFYRHQQSAVVGHSNDPDRWRELGVTGLGEPYEHFVNLDVLSQPPFTDIPTDWDQAVAKYGRERLQQAGTVPWTIERQTGRLVESFRRGDWPDVVLRSAWLGHYLADTSNPMHLTRNYKGQETGNIVLQERGPNQSVHQRFEWGLVERFPAIIDFDDLSARPPVAATGDISTKVWSLVRESYPAADTVMKADREAAAKDRTFSGTYYQEMYSLTGEIARQRLERSVDALAILWLTAWERAGRPTMPETVVSVVQAQPIAVHGILIPVGIVVVGIVLLPAAVWVIVRWRPQRH